MTNKEKENPLFDAGLQKQICALIAQECLVSRLYTNSMMGVDPASAGALAEMFESMSEQAMSEAFQLVEWCKQYGYDVPCGDAELKRSAGSKVAKLADIKKGQAAGYYIDQAAKMEAEIMLTCKETIDKSNISAFTNLQSTVWQIMYAKQNALQSMGTAKIAFLANADLVIGY